MAGQRAVFPSGRGSAVHAHHDGGGLDDRVGRAAHLQPQLPDGTHGDGGGDDVPTADVDPHDAVYRPLFNGENGALELISCAEFYNCFSFICVVLSSLCIRDPEKIP